MTTKEQLIRWSDDLKIAVLNDNEGDWLRRLESLDKLREFIESLASGPSQLITWLPGGAQGAEMPAFTESEGVLVDVARSVLPYARYGVRETWVKGKRLYRSRLGYEISWSDVRWYIPTAALLPPEVES